MKKLFYLLLLIFFGNVLFAQTHLRISHISGIPVTGIPNNTVYEVNTYDSITVTIVNDDTLSFSDSISIYIKSDSIQFIDTLVNATSVNIARGDSITLHRSGFVFSHLYFDEGDNIVVVWPAARITPIVSASVTFNIFFISLLASSPETPNEEIILFPNPVSKYLSIDGLNSIEIKQVRIYDLSGKEIYTHSSIQRLIPIENLSPGIYLLNIEKRDGSTKVFKFQKN